MRAPDRSPTFEGRPLPRPVDELVDQGLAFDVGTLLSRRTLLGMLGLGAATVGLAACGGTSSTSSSTSSSAGAATGEIPDETAGPYPATAPTARTSWSRAASSAATSDPASATRTAPPKACR